ncbi:MAG: hypothetical protein WC248_04075 [Candidatus Methanomethylophilaceae archaeon]|jgi:hypothetical protein
MVSDDLIDKTLERHERNIQEHDKQIEYLNKCAVQNATNIQSLIKQISAQTSAVWGLVAAFIITLVGFVLSVVLKGA